MNIPNTCWVAIIAEDAVENLNLALQFFDEIGDKMKRTASAVFIFTKNSSLINIEAHSMTPAIVSQPKYYSKNSISYDKNFGM